MYKSIKKIQIRFSDVDSVGHVSNTQYQNFYDLGKLDYFDKVLPDMDFNKLAVVGASVKIDFILPVFMRTEVVVKTRVTRLGNKSMTLEHQLCDAHTDVLYSTCTAVMVCYDVKTMQSMPIPAEWRRSVEAFEKLKVKS